MIVMHKHIHTHTFSPHRDVHMAGGQIDLFKFRTDDPYKSIFIQVSHSTPLCLPITTCYI